MSNKFAIISFAALAYLTKKIIPHFLPFGPAFHVSEEDAPKFGPFDVSNDSLRAKCKFCFLCEKKENKRAT